MRTQIDFKYLGLFLLFISLCVVLIILFSRIGVSGIINTINPEPTLIKMNISEISPQNDGQRIAVEGVFHNRNRWMIVGYEFDCKNYWLEEQPSGESIDLCISTEHFDEFNYMIGALEGEKVLISGTVVNNEGASYQWQHIRIDAEDTIEVLP